MKTLLFAMLAIIQLGVPLAMVAKYEAVLAFGREYKFRCAPVDPSDPLRGRYVALDFEAARRDGQHEYNLPRWVALASDEKGFAKVADVLTAPPAKGDFIKATTTWNGLQFPFNQYFMNESSAPEAEAAYWHSARRPAGESRDWKPDTYLVVKVWRGQAVGKQLFIDGKPVEELVGKGRR